MTGTDEVGRTTRHPHLRWAGHPAMVVCVAVLIANDHVLKARYPGWWTGKLSDFAGVAAVGFVGAAMLGRRLGPTVVGLGFGMVKAVPGVAEVLAPVLGGITRRDVTDLAALVVLPPVSILLRHDPRAETNDDAPRRSRSGAGAGATLVAAAASVAPIVGLVFATAATTATSCGPRATVVTVGTVNDAIYARVGAARGTGEWQVTTDGGWTWREARAAERPPEPVPAVDLYLDPGPIGPQEACAEDGTCWRLRDRRSIERVDPDGSVIDEFALSDEEFHRITTGCAGGSIGVLASITSTDTAQGPRVVASLGADGAVARRSDGTWDRVRVGGAPRVTANRFENAAGIGVVGYLPVAVFLMWSIGRRRWPSWLSGIGVVTAGWVATLGAAVVITSLTDPAADVERMFARITLPGLVITTAAAIVAARRPRPLRRFGHLPPPPPGTGDVP